MCTLVASPTPSAEDTPSAAEDTRNSAGIDRTDSDEDVSTKKPVCKCSAGFRGEDCSLRQDCPNACCGNGVCSSSSTLPDHTAQKPTSLHSHNGATLPSPTNKLRTNINQQVCLCANGFFGPSCNLDRAQHALLEQARGLRISEKKQEAVRLRELAIQVGKMSVLNSGVVTAAASSTGVGWGVPGGWALLSRLLPSRGGSSKRNSNGTALLSQDEKLQEKIQSADSLLAAAHRAEREAETLKGQSVDGLPGAAGLLNFNPQTMCGAAPHTNAHREEAASVEEERRESSSTLAALGDSATKNSVPSAEHFLSYDAYLHARTLLREAQATEKKRLAHEQHLENIRHEVQQWRLQAGVISQLAANNTTTAEERSGAERGAPDRSPDETKSFPPDQAEHRSLFVRLLSKIVPGFLSTTFTSSSYATSRGGPSSEDGGDAAPTVKQPPPELKNFGMSELNKQGSVGPIQSDCKKNCNYRYWGICWFSQYYSFGDIITVSETREDLQVFQCRRLGRTKS